MSALNVAAITSSYSLTAFEVFTFVISDEPLTAKQAGLLILSLGAPKLLAKMFKSFKFCNSFDGDTMVYTESGLKSISEVSIGEKVWTYDIEMQQESLQEVVHLIESEGVKNLVQIRLENGEIITSTSEHPFYDASNNDWINAGDLSIESVLYGYNNKPTLIESVHVYRKDIKVYNLTIRHNHNYFVGKNKVLSHNIGGLCNLSIGAISAGSKFKSHFMRHKGLLTALTGKSYKKLKTHGQEFLDDIQGLVNNGTVKYVGQGTLKRGQDVLHIYKGNGVTLALKNSNEFVTLLRTGEGMGLAVKLVK